MAAQQSAVPRMKTEDHVTVKSAPDPELMLYEEADQVARDRGYLNHRDRLRHEAEMASARSAWIEEVEKCDKADQKAKSKGYTDHFDRLQHETKSASANVQPDPDLESELLSLPILTEDCSSIIESH